MQRREEEEEDEEETLMMSSGAVGPDGGSEGRSVHTSQLF